MKKIELNMNLPQMPEIPEIIPVSHFLKGEATFRAMKDAVEKLVRLAPEDHDVLIQAFDITVREVTYVEPHTLLLSGFNNHGHETCVVAHHSQLVAHVIYRPKEEGKKRVITGFLEGTKKHKQSS